MSTRIENYDWKAHARHVKAAGAQPQPSTLEIERAFMDQAWSHIEPRAGKLMDDPYRLGFEIVAKKEGNTKLCGMFAFRLHGELLYAPAFFLNGQIKGTDLLYLHGPKKFKPFTEEWVTWLTDRAQSTRGQGIDRAEGRRNRPTDIHFERIAYPPHMQKYSAEHGPVPGIDMTWDEWIKESTTVVNDLKLDLKEFLQGPGQGWATEKVASLVRESPHFAQAIVRRFGNDWETLFGPDSWSTPTKQASAGASLILHTDIQEGATEDQISQFYKRGYYIEDARPQEVLTLTYENGPRDIEQFGEASLGEVLGAKGEFTEAAVFPECSDTLGSKECTEESLADSSFDPWDDGERAAYRVIAVKGDGATTYVDRYADPIMGKPMKNLADCLRDEESWILDKPSKGSAYVMLDIGTGLVSKPFFVVKTSTRGGVTECTVCPSGSGYGKKLIINPAISQTSIAHAMAGENARFIKVKHEGSITEDDDGYCRGVKIPRGDVSIGTVDAINHWIFNGGSEMKKLAVSRRDHDELEINFNGTIVRNLPRVEAFAKLAADLNLPGSVADEIIDEALEKGAAHRVLEEGEAVKSAAARLQLNDHETFQTHRNDVFGIDQESPQSFLLRTDAFGQGPEPHRIGDAFDPSMGGSQNRPGSTEVGGVPEALLFGASPEMIAQFSETEQLPQVFDHGVIGSLTGTYDSGSMIDNFLDDLEVALDRLGRILFLLYWKPADFEKDYGTDDMQNLENELLSTFKGYGDLVLNLLKKAKGRNEPSNVFTSMG